MRGPVTMVVLVLLGVTLLVVAADMPRFGDPDAPVHNVIPERFLARGPEETGSVNMITAIILDYRSYDTLGEATVLFAAVIATMAVIAATRGGEGSGSG